MPAEVIRGVVASGQGGASRAMVGDRLEERSEVAGAQLVPGTLNVRVADLQGAVDSLGEPVAVTERDAAVGPLRWWPVTVRAPEVGIEEDGHVVRHERTRTKYIEIVAPVSFRELGVEDGDAVEIEPR